jgi:hypothetical protein
LGFLTATSGGATTAEPRYRKKIYALRLVLELVEFVDGVTQLQVA